MAWHVHFIWTVARCAVLLCFYAVEAALLLGLLAWSQRAHIFPLLLGCAQPVDVSARAIDVAVQWAAAPLRRLRRLDAPFDVLVISVRNVAVHSPFGPTAAAPPAEPDAAAAARPRALPASPSAAAASSVAALRLPREPLAQAETAVVTLRYVAARSFGASILLDGLDVHVIGYDGRYRDTNLSRLADALAAADPNRRRPRGRPPPRPHWLQPAVAIELITFRRLALHIERNSSGRAGDARPVLPAVTMVEETVEPARLTADGGRLSVGLLVYLNQIAFRTLASTSIDAVRASLGFATGVAGSALERSLDFVDSLNRTLAVRELPGGSVALGAAEGARLALGGAVLGARSAIDGVADGAHDLASAALGGRAPSGGSGGEAGALCGASRGLCRMALGVGAGGAALGAGAGAGLGALAAGVAATAAHSPAAAAASAASALASVAAVSVPAGAACVRGGALECVAAVQGGLSDGQAAAGAGVCSGAADAAAGLAAADLSRVARGGGRAARGLARGASAVLGGACEGVAAARAGLGEGLMLALGGRAAAKPAAQQAATPARRGGDDRATAPSAASSASAVSSSPPAPTAADAAAAIATAVVAAAAVAATGATASAATAADAAEDTPTPRCATAGSPEAEPLDSARRAREREIATQLCYRATELRGPM